MLTGEPYPVRALYVSGVNIVVTYPETQKTIEALMSLDFLLVATHMMTPTAELADIVLPKTTGLEDEEVALKPSSLFISTIRPVVAPLGEARSDFAIARDLVRRAEARGLNDTRRFFPWERKRDFNQFLLGSESGLTMEALLEAGYAEFPYELGNFAAQGFKTPTGKVELYSET